jgi:hypothetical protein
LQDQAFIATPAARPAMAELSVRLLWLSLGIGVVQVPLDWPFASRPFVTLSAFIVIFTFAMVAFFIWKIGQGKNWARIVFLLFFLLGVEPYVSHTRSHFTHSVLSGTLGAVQFGLEVVGLCLIFTSELRED